MKIFLQKSVSKFFIAAIIGFWTASHAVAASKAKAHDYRYVVSWQAWDGEDFDKRDAIVVSLNGKEIGTVAAAFKVLEELPVAKGEHVKVILPPTPAGVKSSRPVHYYSNFIQIWLGKGVLADFFSNGKKLNVKTLTWSDFIKKGNFVVKMDDVSWSVDGKVVGNGEAMAKQIEEWGRHGDIVVQDVIPPGWLPPGVTVHGVVNEVLERLKAERRIRILPVRPDRDASEKYLRETLFPSLKNEAELGVRRERR